MGLQRANSWCCKALIGWETLSLGDCPRGGALSGDRVSLLDRLSNHGLILRVRAEGDRRQMLVQLTDLGRERLATSPSPLQEEFLGKFRNLPTWEQHMLIASMQKIAEMMNAENLDASPILAVGEIGQGQSTRRIQRPTQVKHRFSK